MDPGHNEPGDLAGPPDSTPDPPDERWRKGARNPTINEERRADERRLVAAAREGDSRAFAVLVRDHQHEVFGLVSRMVRDRQVAEELTQDVFVKAWRNLPGFRGDSRFATWLYRITVNLCQDYQQSRKARDQRRETGLEMPEGTPREGFPPAPRPDEVRMEQEMARAFEASLNALPASYLAAFLLYHQQGLAMEDVADALGISRSNAKVRVHRAREMVLEALRRRGYDV